MIGTITDWRTYAADRGDDAPTSATNELATEALVRASDYITHHYVRHFLSGYDATSDYVEEATYEAASLELATPGFFTATYTAQERKVLTEVKGIKWTVVQGEADRAEAWANATPVSTRIESMLSPYMSTRRRVGFTVLNAPA